MKIPKKWQIPFKSIYLVIDVVIRNLLLISFILHTRCYKIIDLLIIRKDGLPWGKKIENLSKIFRLIIKWIVISKRMQWLTNMFSWLMRRRRTGWLLDCIFSGLLLMLMLICYITLHNSKFSIVEIRAWPQTERIPLSQGKAFIILNTGSSTKKNEFSLNSRDTD